MRVLGRDSLWLGRDSKRRGRDSRETGLIAQSVLMRMGSFIKALSAVWGKGLCERKEPPPRFRIAAPLNLLLDQLTTWDSAIVCVAFKNRSTSSAVWQWSGETRTMASRFTASNIRLE